ncbi:acyltransferase family protein [Paenibacillus sp. FSL K6-1318]|uniref:acyltransferase family protein n=1 Tax=Paenibacillus sp. FSL K6-1318 TaxID=2975291 RepID=UPI0030EBE43C
MNGKNNQTIKRYMPGIDGLRAISVLAVIAYHFDFKWAQGGLLGVGIFFVLSGYLITDQILLEWRMHRNIFLWNFWVRRLRRLLPAMIGMLMFVAMWLIVTDPTRLLSLSGDFISSVFYVNNWYLIFHNVSYFDSFGPPSPIGHLWSLSIEEQFYLVWPVVLLLAIRFAPRRGRLMVFIAMLASISAIAMAVMYEPGTDPSRVYYGTDTRAFAILIGAALAVGWPSWKLNRRISPIARTLLDCVGGLGLIILLILIYRTNEYDESLYRSGFLYLSIISAIVIAILAQPASRLAKLLGCKSLTWIGKRSYSLYIWHYPVITLMHPTGNERLNFLQIMIQLIITFILSMLSYTWIEEPIRKVGVKAQLRFIRSHHWFKPAIILAFTLLALFRIESWITNETKVRSESVQPVIVQEVASNNQQESNTDNTEEIPAPMVKGEGITVIGDSLALNVASVLEEILPGIVVDGKVGRQMSQAKSVIEDLREKDKLGDRIVIALGTNGAFNQSSLSSLLDALQGEKKIYLVTTRVPKNWQNTVNEALKDVARDYPNVKIIDWYAASDNKNDLFYHDGVHLTPEGARFYASVLVEHIQEDQG